MTRDEVVLYMFLYRQRLINSVGDLKEDIEAYDMALEALKCIGDIKKYLTDPDVTWRDISDDCITEIMIEHGFMTREEGN